MAIEDRFYRLEQEGAFGNPTDQQFNYVDKVAPTDILKDARFIRDVKNFFYERDGKTFASDKEAVDEFYKDRTWRNTNSVSMALDLKDAIGFSQDQKQRFLRLSNAYEKLPNFYENGGRGWQEAIPQYLAAGVADPVNLLGFGAGKGAATAVLKGAQNEVMRGLAGAAVKEGALNFGIGTAQDVLMQQTEKAAGGRDTTDFVRAAEQGATNAALGGVIGTLFNIPSALKGSRLGQDLKTAIDKNDIPAMRAARQAAAEEFGGDFVSKQIDPFIQKAEATIANDAKAAAEADAKITAINEQQARADAFTNSPHETYLNGTNNSIIDLKKRLADVELSASDRQVLQSELDATEANQKIAQQARDKVLEREKLQQEFNKAQSENPAKASEISDQIRKIDRELADLNLEKVANEKTAEGIWKAAEEVRKRTQDPNNQITNTPRAADRDVTPGSEPSTTRMGGGDEVNASTARVGNTGDERPFNQPQGDLFSDERTATPREEPNPDTQKTDTLAASEAANVKTAQAVANERSVQLQSALDNANQIWQDHQIETGMSPQTLGRQLKKEGIDRTSAEGLLEIQKRTDELKAEKAKASLADELVSSLPVDDQQAAAIRKIIMGLPDDEIELRAIPQFEALEKRMMTAGRSVAIDILNAEEVPVSKELREIILKEVAEKIVPQFTKTINQDASGATMSGVEGVKTVFKDTKSIKEIADDLSNAIHQHIFNRLDAASPSKPRAEIESVEKGSEVRRLMGDAAAVAQAQQLGETFVPTGTRRTRQTLAQQAEIIAAENRAKNTEGLRKDIESSTRTRNLAYGRAMSELPEGTNLYKVKPGTALYEGLSTDAKEAISAYIGISKKLKEKERKYAAASKGPTPEEIAAGAAKREAEKANTPEARLEAAIKSGELPPYSKEQLDELRKAMREGGETAFVEKIAEFHGTPVPVTAATPAPFLPKGQLPAVVLRNESGEIVGKPRILDPRQLRPDATLEDYYRLLVGKSTDNWERGFLPEEARGNPFAEKRQFVSENSEVAAKPAPTKLEDVLGQRIVFDGNETTYGELWHGFAEMDLRSPTNLGDLEKQIAHYRKLNTVFPNEMLLPTATRREAISALQDIYAGNPAAFIAAEDALRRLNISFDRAPIISREADADFVGSFRFDTNELAIRKGGRGSADQLAPNLVFAHELGHWGYFNLLSFEDRADFLQWTKRFYDDTGNFSDKSAQEFFGKSRSGIAGATKNTQEIFANAFSHFMNGEDKIPYREAQGLWKEISRKFFALVKSFLAPWDTPRELVPLFKKIIPDDNIAARWERDYISPSDKAINLTATQRKNANQTISFLNQARERATTLDRAINGNDVVSLINAIDDTKRFIYARTTPQNSRSLFPNGSGQAPIAERMLEIRNAQRAAHELTSQRELSVEGDLDRLVAEQYKDAQSFGIDPTGRENEFRDNSLSIIETSHIIQHGEKPDQIAEVYGIANRLSRAYGDYTSILESMYERQTGYKVAPHNALNPERLRTPSQEKAIRQTVNKRKTANARVEEQANKTLNAKTDKTPRTPSRAAVGEKKTNVSDVMSPSKMTPQDLINAYRSEGPNTVRGIELGAELVQRRQAKPNLPKVDVPLDFDAFSIEQLRSGFHKALRDNNQKDLAVYAAALAKRNGEDSSLVAFFTDRINKSIEREATHREGTAFEAGIPPKASEQVKVLLRGVNHNNSMTEYTARTMLYRMLNLLPPEAKRLLGETEVIPIQTLYKMMGREAPADANAVFADLSDPAFKELRSSVRRLAIGIRENNNPFTLMHEVGHLLSRTMLTTEERTIMERAFSLAKDDIATRVRQSYSDLSFERQAEEYIAQSIALHYGGRVARGDILQLAMEGHADTITLKSGLDRLFDQIFEAVAYVFNRLIGNNDMRQVMRRLTWYGDMFAPNSAARNIDITPIMEGVPLKSVESDLRKVLGQMGADQVFKLRNHHRFYENDGSPTLLWHGTTHGGKLDHPEVSIRFTEQGSGTFGYGFYTSESNTIADKRFARMPTRAAYDAMVDQLTNEGNKILLDPVERANFEKLFSDRLSITRDIIDHENDMLAIKNEVKRFKALGVEVSEGNSQADLRAARKVGKNYEAAYQQINEELAKYGAQSRTYPVSVYSKKSFDFRDRAEYTVAGGEMDHDVGKFLFTLEKQGLIDPTFVMHLEDIADYGVMSGKRLYDEVVNEIEQHTGAIGSDLGYNKNTGDHINDALLSLGYDSLRASDYDRSLSNLGMESGHDIVVAFEKSGQVKHLLEATAYDPNLDGFYQSRVPNPDTPRIPIVGSLLNAALRSDDPFMASRFGNSMSPQVEVGGGTGMMANLYRKIARKDASAANDLKSFSHPLQMQTNANRMREYAGARWVADFISPNEGVGLVERHHSSVSKTLHPIMRLLDELPDAKGFLGNWMRNVSDLTIGLTHQEHLSPVSHKRIAAALRRGEDEIARLDPQERKTAQTIAQTLEDYADRLRDSGVVINKIGNYLPQLWDASALLKNPDKFQSALADFFMREAKAERRQDMTRDVALARAKSTFAKLTDEDGVPVSTISAGSRAPVMDAEYRRMIKLQTDPVALKELEPFLVSDLSSLMVKYIDTAERRIAFADKFGVGNHGYYDYARVATGGVDEASSLLSTRKIIQKTSKAILEDNEITDQTKTLTAMTPMTPELADLAARAAKKAIDDGGTAQDALDAIMTIRDKSGIKDIDNGKTFEKRATAIANALADMPRGVAASELDHMDTTFRAVQNKRVYTGFAADSMYSAARGLRNFNSVSLLSFATLSSFSDIILPMVRSGSFKASYKALVNYSTDPIYREAIRNIGVGVEGLIHERMALLHGGQTSGIFDGRRTNAFFNLTGLTPWTEMGREIAGIHGYEAMKAMIEKAQQQYTSGSSSREYRTAKRFLDHYGLGEYASDPSKYFGDIAEMSKDDKVRAAIIKFANESVFTPNPNDIPVWAQTPWGMLAFQLKSYPLMMGRLAKHVGGEALEGNLGPIAMMLSLGVGGGAGALALKDIVQGRGGDEKGTGEFALRERSFQKVAEEYGLKGKSLGKVNVMGTQVDVDKFMGWYIEGFLTMGGFGIMSDMLHSIGTSLDNGQFGVNRAASWVFGPSYGLGTSAFNVLAGIDHMALGEDGTNFRERSAVREVATRLPILGGLKPFREQLTNSIAGERQENGGGGGGFSGGFGGGFGGSFGGSFGSNAASNRMNAKGGGSGL